MAYCLTCGKEKGFFEGGNGLCGDCFARNLSVDAKKSAEKSVAEQKAKEAERAALEMAAERVQLTTEAFVGDVGRLGIVSAEVVLGMNIFKDVLANVRDIFGGRSGVVQDTLSDARKIAFTELKWKAAALGADAVIAVDIDYHSISTGSAVNMMIVSVNGTAVKWSN